MQPWSVQAAAEPCRACGNNNPSGKVDRVSPVCGPLPRTARVDRPRGCELRHACAARPHLWAAATPPGPSSSRTASHWAAGGAAGGWPRHLARSRARAAARSRQEQSACCRRRRSRASRASAARRRRATWRRARKPLQGRVACGSGRRGHCTVELGETVVVHLPAFAGPHARAPGPRLDNNCCCCTLLAPLPKFLKCRAGLAGCLCTLVCPWLGGRRGALRLGRLHSGAGRPAGSTSTFCCMVDLPSFRWC